VTGRLNETLGGIRIVKTYTAEKREELVSPGASTACFRNVAQSITGVSGITAFSPSSSAPSAYHDRRPAAVRFLAGHMTLGDFINYILSRPHGRASRADRVNRHADQRSVSAGLDRIHDLMTMRTEDDWRDSTRAPLDVIDGEIAFGNVTFSESAPACRC